jgi:hypothetical protein
VHAYPRSLEAAHSAASPRRNSDRARRLTRPVPRGRPRREVDNIVICHNKSIRSVKAVHAPSGKPLWHGRPDVTARRRPASLPGRVLAEATRQDGIGCAESEAAIQRALETALAGRTSLVIADRLATIRGADQILVIDAGQIAERGDPRRAAGTLYAEVGMAEAQLRERSAAAAHLHLLVMVEVAAVEFHECVLQAGSVQLDLVGCHPDSMEGQDDGVDEVAAAAERRSAGGARGRHRPGRGRVLGFGPRRGGAVRSRTPRWWSCLPRSVRGSRRSRPRPPCRRRPCAGAPRPRPTWCR